jgi:hypothetical protein
MQTGELLMPEQKNPKDQLENQVAQLRDLAIRSSDPLIKAKAVAASNPDVQQLILKRLTGNERLVEVIALDSAGRNETQVFFRFIPSEEQIHLVDQGILVFVDTTKGEVAGIKDPYQLQPEQRAARPFVLVSPPDTSQFAAREDETREIAARERSFFQSVGLRPGGLGIATVIDTIFGTETWSAGRPDDTRSDRTSDYRDEVVIVIY